MGFGLGCTNKYLPRGLMSIFSELARVPLQELTFACPAALQTVPKRGQAIFYDGNQDSGPTEWGPPKLKV